MSPKPRHNPPVALGYIRCSTAEQSDSGLGLDAQRHALEAEAQRRGWHIEIVADEGVSGKSMDRPGIQSALRRLDSGEADILVTIRLDRVSRSVRDGANLIERAKENKWSLVILDIGLDMSSPAGRFAYNVILSAAQFERDLIAQRTKDALAEAKRRGTRLGRPQVLPDEVVLRILDARDEGRTLAAIATALTNDGVPTARGGAHWQPSSVKAVARSQRAMALRGGRP